MIFSELYFLPVIFYWFRVFGSTFDFNFFTYTLGDVDVFFFFEKKNNNNKSWQTSGKFGFLWNLDLNKIRVIKLIGK